MKPFMLAAWFAGLALSQPAFESASVRPSADTGNRHEEEITTTPGRLVIRNATVSACIRWAYDVAAPQVISKTPLSTLLYDFVAQANGPATETELKVMLQTLLADRFKLTAHQELRTILVYALEAGKAKEKLEPSSGGDGSIRPQGMALAGQGVTMAQLAASLSRSEKLPVIDLTSLAGRYNFKIDMAAIARGPIPQDDDMARETMAILMGLQDQLGFKVEKRKVALKAVVIDHIEKPTEN
jgi:uncharacterized protein (TIGR03435 family)